MPIYQLLVRIKDKVNLEDKKLNAVLTKRGDVIHIADASHQWGKRELENPEWTIIIVDLSKSEAESLISPELKQNETQILRKRGLKLDLDNLNIFYNGKRHKGKFYNKTTVKNCIKMKPILLKVNNELGPSNEIGPE